MSEPWNADGMRADSECGFKMFCMHEQSGKFIAIFVKPEQNSEADIINSTLHCPIHGFGVIIVVMLWSGRMK